MEAARRQRSVGNQSDERNVNGAEWQRSPVLEVWKEWTLETRLPGGATVGANTCAEPAPILDGVVPKIHPWMLVQRSVLEHVCFVRVAVIVTLMTGGA